MRTLHPLAYAVLLAAVLAGDATRAQAFAVPVQANGFRFTPIADTSTPIPGGQGNFTRFEPPVISGRTIAFVGRGRNDSQGIYLFNGRNLVRAVDGNTPIPNGKGKFRYVSEDPLAISGGTIVFRGKDDRALEDPAVEIGIYAYQNGRLRRIADRRTPIPGGGGRFENLEDPVVSGNRVAFRGSNLGFKPSQRALPKQLINGIYLHNGSRIERVADIRVPISRQGVPFPLQGFGSFAISGNTLALTRFRLDLGRVAELYLYSGNRLRRIPTPNGVVFNSVELATSGRNVLITGQRLVNSQTAIDGLYLYDGRAFRKVVEAGEPAPGMGGRFNASFVFPSLSGSSLAFNAASEGDRYGAYTFRDRKLVKILGVGDRLGNRTVESVNLQYRYAVDGNRIALRVGFGDRAQAIYVVD